MRKIYINLGCGDGEVTRGFLEKNPGYEAYGFDPFDGHGTFDAKLQEIGEEYDFKYSRKAAWVSNERKTFYQCGKGGVCSSLMREKFATRFSNLISQDGHFAEESPVKEQDVECFHFSQWLENNFSSEDYIVLYMDIEISEFYILNDMISNGTIGYIDELIVEFHKQAWKWVYSESLRRDSENLHEKITKYMDEKFRTKIQVPARGGASKNAGGMWRWKK